MSLSANIKIESGVQLLARLTKKPNIENFYPILFQSGPKNGQFIEIFSGSCASYLLTDIISEALVQTKLNGIGAGVLVFNTDGHINFDELLNTTRKKILSSLTYTTLEQELHSTMSNLHILNIYDATQFYTTIHKMENILAEYPNISLIIFDSLTAFYWSEQGFKIKKMDFYTKNLINTIQKVTKEYKTICVYTRPEYFCTNKDSDNISADISHQIQVLDSENGNYQVNIKTTDVRTTKFFKIVDGDIKWNSF